MSKCKSPFNAKPASTENPYRFFVGLVRSTDYCPLIFVQNIISFILSYAQIKIHGLNLFIQ
ncbi:hypothetical protein BpHYR1_028706 [Brachionus plicatilis]|uniref:Uncharacterized protein n=1 Tax=Brachionus plicatilis TaxID=10195 RepID=A0A3M7PLV1_BRAPC|nr:hypothetical protein BpHYR1_028706 [Brachionus plicatilis]